jgi:hypothetical protein
VSFGQTVMKLQRAFTGHTESSAAQCYVTSYHEIGHFEGKTSTCSLCKLVRLYYCKRYEVLIRALVKIQIFWDMTLCRLVTVTDVPESLLLPSSRYFFSRYLSQKILNLQYVSHSSTVIHKCFMFGCQKGVLELLFW